MPTRYPEIFSALAAPFDSSEVKTRPGGNGRTLSYISARTVRNRLDEVMGPEAWSDRYYEVCNVLFCEITLTLPDGSKVAKADAGGFKEMTEKGQIDQENTDKTGASDALKRAAAAWGIGRYLYRDGVAHFGNDGASESSHAAPPRPNGHANGNGNGYAPPPPPPRQAPARPVDSPINSNRDRLPENGKALFAWIMKQQERLEAPVLRKMNEWQRAEKSDWPKKTTDWSPEQVAEAVAFLVPLIESYETGCDNQDHDTPRPRVPAPPAPPSRTPIAPRDQSSSLALAKGDPLEHVKLPIKDAVKEVVSLLSGGAAPTPEDCEARLNYYGTQLTDDPNFRLNLRECRDRPLLEDVLGAVRKDLAAYAQPGGVA